MQSITTLREIPSEIQDDLALLYLQASLNNENYTVNRMKEPTIATTVVYEDDVLVGASSILMREFFTVPRIMNRYFYADLGFRGLLPSGFNGNIRSTFAVMFEQQADLIYKLGYTGCFTSREKKTAFPRLVRGLNDYSKYKWEYDLDNTYCVTEDYQRQYIIWTGDKYEDTRSI